MKSIQWLLIFVFSSSCFAQSITDSKSEGYQFSQLNHAWASARTYSSKQYYLAVIDSINQFLEQYPNSVYKTGLLNYKLDLVSTVSSDEVLTNRIADTLLFYDSLAQTKLGIAEIFIDKNLNAARGASMIHGILPLLDVNNQRYRAFNLLAHYDISKGDYLSAKTNLLSAIKTDSTRYESWYSYLSLLKAREDVDGVKSIELIIKRLEDNDLLNYGEESSTSPNLFKEIYSYNFTNMDGKPVSLSSFRKNVVVINCFAFWCGACVPELQMLHSLSKRFPKVTFLFVNMPPHFVGGNPKDTRLLLNKPKYECLQGHEILFPNDEFERTLDIKGVPTTFIIDKQGVIRFDYLGFAKGSEELIRNNLRQLSSEK